MMVGIMKIAMLFGVLAMVAGSVEAAPVVVGSPAAPKAVMGLADGICDDSCSGYAESGIIVAVDTSRDGNLAGFKLRRPDGSFHYDTVSADWRTSPAALAAARKLLQRGRAVLVLGFKTGAAQIASANEVLDASFARSATTR